MAFGSSVPTQVPTAQVCFSIDPSQIPLYQTGLQENNLSISLPGQAKRVWIAGTDADSHFLTLNVSYCLLSEGEQALPLKFCIWQDDNKSALPRNAITVREYSDRLFLLSPQERVQEISNQDIYRGSFPPARSVPTVRFDRPICQARMVVFGTHGRAIVYTSREALDKSKEYYLIAVPSSFRKRMEGAIRILSNPDVDPGHYYAVPFNR